MTEIDQQALHELYSQLNTLVGTENMLKIWRVFNGMQVTFPAHLYSRQLAALRIQQLYDGTNTRDLARRYQYSQKWVQQVLKAQRK
ncbi:Mor transcription activator family protein [Secundilactobacillus similis]|nr:Mor transcription activator family protein [Secundilactobacillus similis]